MKNKILLLGALVCAGQLYGMEPLYPKQDVLAGSWENLPAEIKSLIITAVAQSSDNLDEVIKNIVRFSQVSTELNKMINLNDLQGFTKIVHMLKKQFKYITLQGIAKSFHTPLAKRYLQLANELDVAIGTGNVEDAKKLISEGADVNYSHRFLTNAISSSFEKKSTEIVQLLLDNGVNPYEKGIFLQTPLEFLNRRFSDYPEYVKEVKALLENAMKKYQQYPPSH